MANLKNPDILQAITRQDREWIRSSLLLFKNPDLPLKASDRLFFPAWCLMLRMTQKYRIPKKAFDQKMGGFRTITTPWNPIFNSVFLDVALEATLRNGFGKFVREVFSSGEEDQIQVRRDVFGAWFVEMYQSTKGVKVPKDQTRDLNREETIVLLMQLFSDTGEFLFREGELRESLVAGFQAWHKSRGEVPTKEDLDLKQLRPIIEEKIFASPAYRRKTIKYFGPNGLLRFGPRQVRDLLGRGSADRGKKRRGLNSKAKGNPRTISQSDLDLLEALGNLGRFPDLKEKERLIAELGVNAAIEGEIGRLWGRSHLRLVLAAGIQLSQPGLLKMGKRIEKTLRAVQ